VFTPDFGPFTKVGSNLWSSVLREKLIVTQLVKKFFASYRTRSFITVFTLSATGSYPEPDASSPQLPILFEIL
jgi:hypothetical protein